MILRGVPLVPSYLLRLAAAAGLYFLAGRVGLSLAFVNESTSAVWPPAGIALTALLLLGIRAWPAVALGAFLVNVTNSGGVGASLAIAAGNSLEAVSAAWLVTRFARGRAFFERTPDIITFTALAALAAPMVAATVGTATLLAAGLAVQADAQTIWLTWWLGDAAGMVVVTPLVLLVVQRSPLRWSAARVLEAFALAGCAVAVSLLLFDSSLAGARRLPLQFIEMPVLLWAAFRFGARETACLAAGLCFFGIRGTLDGVGPFVLGSPNESLLLVQAYSGVTMLVMLSAAAEVAARRAVETRMRSLNQVLEQRVAARTEELSRVHARLLEAQQVAHVGSWEWDVASNTLWWSEEMCRIYGLAGDSPASYNGFLSRVHPEDRAQVETEVAKALGVRQPFSLDHRIVRPDGSVRMLHAHGRVDLDADGRPVRMVGTGHDVTERIAAEEQRTLLMIEQAARRDAEQASRAKDQFLATLSHELRTPLNVAHGWAHILRRTRAWDERAVRGVEAIHRNLEMLTRLVSDIIDVSRITAGAFRLDTHEVDVATVIESAVETVRESAAARRIAIDARVAPSMPLLNADGRRLQQIVWNLLSNAVKFARDDGTVTVTASGDYQAVQIVVEDDGPGIDPAFLPHVFEEFRQADSSVTREHGGLGLGLSIARHLVELHGGSITAANGGEAGAVFTVRLPVAQAVTDARHEVRAVDAGH